MKFSITNNFRFMCTASKKMNQLLQNRYESAEVKLKELVSRARQLTVCLDEWTKKSLTASFLGISCCFYDRVDSITRHIVLSIKQIQHPHTGEMLKDAVTEVLSEWNIDSTKVLMLVTDNGANVVKAMRLLSEEATVAAAAATSSADEMGDLEDEQAESREDEETSDEDLGDDPDDHCEDDELDFPHIAFRHMPCMAHSLQLVVKKAFRSTHCIIVSKVRTLVAHIRRSGVAVQMLLNLSGKNVIMDNATRWNSSFQMMKRLSELRTSVNQVTQAMKIDSLRVAEWDELVSLVEILEPFAEQTNVLQSDAQSLSYIIPSLLNLQYHLQNFNGYKTLSQSMLQDLNARFKHILEPAAVNHSFNPIPASACLLDPSVARAMFTEDVHELLEAAKSYTITQVCLQQ